MRVRPRRRGTSRPGGAAIMEIRTVGVVGAGVMGVGLGQNLAQTGHEVVLVDVAGATLDRAREEIRKNLRFTGMFRKEAKPPSESTEAVLGRITFTTEYEALGE